MNESILNVTFKNEEKAIDVKIPYIVAFGSNIYQGGVQRETLEYHFEDNEEIYNNLLTIYKHGSTEIAQEYNSGDNIETSTHINYLIPIELTKRVVDDESRVILKLAQLSKIEVMQLEQKNENMQLKGDITNLEIALIELYEEVYK